MTLYTPHFTLSTLHSTLYTPQSPLHTLHSTLYTAHSTFRTLHSTPHTLHPTYTFYTPHSTLHIHTFHFTLHTFHFTLHYNERAARLQWATSRARGRSMFQLLGTQDQDPRDGHWAGPLHQGRRVLHHLALARGPQPHYPHFWTNQHGGFLKCVLPPKQPN